MRLVVILLVLTGLATTAHAQIVNVQGSLAGEPAPGWSGSVAAGVDWQTGNVELVKLTAAASAIYRAGPWTALALARGDYSEGEGVKLAEKTFEHLRGRRALTERLLWEAYVQHEYDAFRRLSVRGIAGTGPAARLITRPRLAVTGGVAYLLELEQRSELAGASDSGDRAWHHRLSAYLVGSARLGAQVTASQTLYVQPRLDAPDDVMLLSESAVESKLAAGFSLVNSFVVTHDASPPETVAATTTALKVAVAFAF